jgi:biotin carboxylase
MTGMRDRAVLILGAGTMQIPAIEAAARMGVKSYVVDGNPEAPGASLADRFEAIDLKDPGKIAAYGRTVPGLAGVFTAGTDFSASVAEVAESLGLPGVPLKVALDASRKERMRERFARAGVPSPSFKAILPGEELRSQLEEARRIVGFPAVVKPVDNMGARGVRKVDAFHELPEAVEAAREYARGGVVICEEWIDGQEYSIDALVYQGELTVTGVAERHIYFEPYFVEMGHTLPANLSSRAYETLIETFASGVRALGIENGAAKGDVFLRADGAGAVGEIAARLSGGYMSGWTYPYATGVPLTEAGLRLAMGEDPRPLLREDAGRTSAERAFISIPGRVKGVEGLPAVRSMEEVRELFLRVEPGDWVAPPRNNVEKCGNIIVVGESREAALTGARRALQTLLVRLDAGVQKTDRYLFDRSVTPTYAWFPRLLEEANRELAPLGEGRLREALLSIAEQTTRTGALPWRVDEDALPEEEYWPPFTPREALERLRAEGVVSRPEGSPGPADSLVKRLFALGGVQGAVYIRESLSVRNALAEERLRGWVDILLEERS